jgi:hypothetical protein
MATTAARKTKPRKTKRPAKAALSNTQLLKLARRSRPPQTWYDENTNPFEPKR